jgi:general secretion pathway protein G
VASPAFTIVELLVVIVVIGILAAITIVAYTGISSKATVASLQSDLTNAKKQLALYQVDNGSFPTSLDGSNCPIPADAKYCLKSSSSNAFTYISSSPYSTFSLSNLNGSTRYSITNNTSPVLGGWIAGVAATALAGKYIYSVDLVSLYQYKTTLTDVVAPQGVIGLDPNYSSNMSLVNPQANPSVDFSVYPAQNACKTFGGRLPTFTELKSIYINRITYGNNFQADDYWSSTEYIISHAYFVNFSSAYEGYHTKYYSYYVRCVVG